MTATPKNATGTFIGASGQIYNVDMYISDVSGALCTFNPSGPAGSSSQTYWRAPENVVLVDLSIESGTADTKGLVWLQDGAVRNGTAMRYSNFLSTLANRAKLNVSFPAGALIQAQQF
jgi:hypothetical protein